MDQLRSRAKKHETSILQLPFTLPTADLGLGVAKRGNGVGSVTLLIPFNNSFIRNKASTVFLLFLSGY